MSDAGEAPVLAESLRPPEKKVMASAAIRILKGIAASLVKTAIESVPLGQLVTIAAEVRSAYEDARMTLGNELFRKQTTGVVVDMKARNFEGIHEDPALVNRTLQLIGEQLPQTESGAMATVATPVLQDPETAQLKEIELVLWHHEQQLAQLEKEGKAAEQTGNHKAAEVKLRSALLGENAVIETIEQGDASAIHALAATAESEVAVDGTVRVRTQLQGALQSSKPDQEQVTGSSSAAPAAPAKIEDQTGTLLEINQVERVAGELHYALDSRQKTFGPAVEAIGNTLRDALSARYQSIRPTRTGPVSAAEFETVSRDLDRLLLSLLPGTISSLYNTTGAFVTEKEAANRLKVHPDWVAYATQDAADPKFLINNPQARFVAKEYYNVNSVEILNEIVLEKIDAVIHEVCLGISVQLQERARQLESRIQAMVQKTA